MYFLAYLTRLESLEQQPVSNSLAQTYRVINQKIWDIFHAILQLCNGIYRDHQMLNQVCQISSYFSIRVKVKFIHVLGENIKVEISI